MGRAFPRLNSESALDLLITSVFVSQDRCCPPKRLTRKQKDSISLEWLLPDYTLWDKEGVEPRFSTEGGTE